MSGNSLTVDQLRRMMLVFDEAYYKKSFYTISDEFIQSFASELDLERTDNNGNGIGGNEDDEDIMINLRENTPSIQSNEHFRFLLASTLVTLLNDRFNSQRRLQINKVINHGFFKPLQRLIALYLVYNLYKHKPIGHHPFLPHFMQIIEHCPKDLMNNNNNNDLEEKKTENDNKNDDKNDKIDDIKTMNELLFKDEIDENKLSLRFGPLCDKIEAEFVYKLLFNRDIDVISKMSAIKFTKIYCDKLINNNLEKWPEFAQINQLIKKARDKNFAYSPLKTLGINPILRDYDLNLDLKLAPFAVDNNVISDLSLDKEFNLYATFDPEIVRPPPPFMIPFHKHEMRWQFLGELPKLIWDDQEFKIDPYQQQQMNEQKQMNNGSKLEMSELMRKALKKQLNENDKNLLIQELKSYYKQHRNLSSVAPSSCLNALCIHNKRIAVEIFLILNNKQNQSIINDYFNDLCTLNVADVETAQNSMNLMKEIAQKIKIPKKYIIQFIAHCVKTCEDTKEPFHQTRLVKYICTFVQDLINQHIISTKDVAVEMEGFCLEFSRSREATKLFKLLKQQHIDVSNDNNANNNDNQ